MTKTKIKNKKVIFVLVASLLLVIMAFIVIRNRVNNAESTNDFSCPNMGDNTKDCSQSNTHDYDGAR